MTQFSSKPPFNDDPEWFCGKCGENSWVHAQSDSECIWEPVDLRRPEFERPQQNPTNPILVARRENPGYNIYYKDLERWPTFEEIYHAQRVLSKWKAVFG